MLLCDSLGCANEAHTFCLGLKHIPVGEWFCPACASLCTPSPRAITLLNAWIMSPAHIGDPYPTTQEKEEIMRECGLDRKQVSLSEAKRLNLRSETRRE